MPAVVLLEHGDTCFLEFQNRNQDTLKVDELFLTTISRNRAIAVHDYKAPYPIFSYQFYFVFGLND